MIKDYCIWGHRGQNGGRVMNRVLIGSISLLAALSFVGPAVADGFEKPHQAARDRAGESGAAGTGTAIRQLER